MQMFPRHAITFSILLAGLASQPAAAQVPEIGVWINHEGKGAVEIKPCGPALCGNIVWLREPLNDEGQPLFDRRNPEESKRTRPICGLPVIGNVKRTSEGWDEGWIYNPEEGAQYDVYLRASGDRLTVTGYKGVKLFSKTFTWTRAPADLQRCEGAAKQTKAKPPGAPVKAATKPAGAQAPAKPTAKVAPAGQGKAATQQAAPGAAKSPGPKDTAKAKTAATPKPAAAAAKPTTAKAPTPKPAVRPAPQAANTPADKKPAAKKAAAPGATATAPKSAATKPAAAKPVAKKKTADETEASSAVE